MVLTIVRDPFLIIKNNFVPLLEHLLPSRHNVRHIAEDSMTELRTVLESLMGSTAAAAMADAIKALFPQEWGDSEGEDGHLEFECVHCGRRIRGDKGDTLQVCPYCYRANWYAPCPQCQTVTAAKGPGVHVCPSCGTKVRVRMGKTPDHAGTSSELDSEGGMTRVMDAMLMLRALYTLVGQMVAIDGWITGDEMNQLDTIFGELGIPVTELPERYFDQMRLLQEGMNSPEGYRQVALHMARLIKSRPGFAEFTHLAVEILTRIAFSDGTLSNDEADFLWELKEIWNMDDAEFEEDVMTALHAMGMDEHYRLLGVHPLASWSDIQEACSRLLAEGKHEEDISRVCKALEKVRKDTDS